MSELYNSYAWVVFIDVYGFSNRVASTSIEQVHDALLLTLQNINRDLENFSFKPTLYSFSDCVFLVFPVPDNKDKLHVLNHCLSVTSCVMSKFYENTLAVRGGIAYGEVMLSDRILIGMPVVRAVKHEGMVAEPIVILPASEVADVDSKKHSGELPEFIEIAVKDGGILAAHVVLPSPIDTFIDLINEQLTETLLSGPPLVARAWKGAKGIIERSQTWTNS